MFSSDGILGTTFAVTAAGLDGIAMRQQVHAENVANIDTPGYRARTVDFERVLGAAMRTPEGAGRAPGTSRLPGGVEDGVQGGVTASVLASRFSSTERPGASGTVDRTKEVSEMMNDNVRFRVLSQQTTNRISELRNVISEMGRG